MPYRRQSHDIIKPLPVQCIVALKMVSSAVSPGGQVAAFLWYWYGLYARGVVQSGLNFAGSGTCSRDDAFRVWGSSMATINC